MNVDNSPTPEPPNAEPIELTVSHDHVGERLDVYLVSQFGDYSRAHLRRVINAAQVLVNGRRAKAAYRLRLDDHVSVRLPDLPRAGPEPEDIPLDIIYEDEHLAVVNKPSGMVVHPAKGHWSGTLASALAFRFAQLSQIGGATRPGIVHRLDRDTSGVIVTAKSDRAHLRLAAQFEARTVKKTYLAIVCGRVDRDADMIDQPIGPHPYQRDKMAIRDSGRPASSFYEMVERFAGFALLRVTPKTGRTHQIRLHLVHAGCPVLCDRLYGGRSEVSRGELLTGQADEEIVLHRQALHASRLELIHPVTEQPLVFEAEMPADLANVLQLLRDAHTASR